MIRGRSVLAVIPARGGSKGLPGKNLALVGGQSLVARAVGAARASTYVDRVILSSDDEFIIAEGLRAGAEAPFVRPADLSGDEATSADVLLHALSAAPPRPQLVVLLQPTSPFRRSGDIDRCLEALIGSGAAAALTVVEVPTSPQVMYWLDADGVVVPVLDCDDRPTRRQDLRPAFTPNGAVYALDVAAFTARPDFVPAGAVAVVMSADCSLDIDDAADLCAAQRDAHRLDGHTSRAT